MKKVGVLIGLMAVAVLLTGCMSMRQGDFTIISNKNLSRSINIPDTKDVPITEGVSKMQVFLIVPVGAQPTIEDALDDALQKGRGNAMVDAVVESYTKNFILFAEIGCRVKGKVVDIK